MVMKHVEEQNIKTSELRLRLQDANSRMTEVNHKASLDVARLLEEERTNAEAERHKFLAQISAMYDSLFEQRWDRLQGNYGIICSDLTRSGDLIEGLATHSRIDDCIAKQQLFAEELVNFKNQLNVRIGQDRKVRFLKSVFHLTF